jgi:hypothetical protein
VRKRRAELYEQAAGQVTDLLPEALQALRVLVVDEDVSPDVRLRAVRAVVDAAHAFRGDDLTARLDHLEQTITDYLAAETGEP